MYVSYNLLQKDALCCIVSEDIDIFTAPIVLSISIREKYLNFGL